MNNYATRAAIAVFVAALCWLPFTPARIAGFLLAAGLLPGCAIAARSRFHSIESLGFGAAISPVVFGIFALLALWTHADVTTAAWVATGANLGVFVFAWRSADPAQRPSINRRVLVGLALLIGVAALMSFALPLSNSWWRTRDDSWFHAAVTNKLLRDGLPLTDPYFAGLRLQYMYFYHAILGACVSITRVDAFHAMILVNVIALVSCATAFHALAGLFATRVGPRLLATGLWLFGMNGWFYLFYVTRIVEGNPFMFLDKFMLGTAFSLTFSLASGVLCMLLSARRGAWSVRHDAVLFLCIAGMMFLHPVTGVSIAAVTLAVLALLLLVRSQTARGGPSYARLVAGIGAALAASVPYVLSVMPRGGSTDALAGFAFQPLVALGLLAAILPALAFTVCFFRGAAGDTDTADRFGASPFRELTVSGSGLLALWCVSMLLVALHVDLPENNETKFAFFLWLPLCAFSAGCFEHAWSYRRWRSLAVAAVISAALPLHALYFHHAVRDRSTLSVTDQERAVYQWVAKSVPRDAIFIEEQDIVRVPVLADRDLYWGTETYARQFGYPRAEMAARRELRDRVYSDQGLSADDIVQLRVLGRRVFVVYRIKDDDVIAAPERFEHSHKLRGKFATTEVAVWEVILD